MENNKVETASPTTEQNNKQLEDQNKTVTNQKQAQTPQVSDKNQEYSVNITNIDDSTGQTLYGTDSFKAKAGDKSHRIYTGYAGYKLMNPEALEGYEVQYPAFGHANLVVPDHDVNLTLHFAPLAPTTVEYVDTDGNLLTKFSDSSKASTSKSPYSDQDGIEDSKFMARAIDIPGYELVSDPVVEKPITQVSTKDDLNPMIIKFVYKKVAKNAEQGLPDGGGTGITGVGEDYGINWSKLPGGVSIDLVNKTYGDNSFEKHIAEKYSNEIPKDGELELNQLAICDLVRREDIKSLQAGVRHLIKHRRANRFLGGSIDGLDEICRQIETMDSTLLSWYNKVECGIFEFKRHSLEKEIDYFILNVRNVNSAFLAVELIVFPAEEKKKELREVIHRNYSDEKGYAFSTLTGKSGKNGAYENYSVVHYNNASLKADKIYEIVSCLEWNILNELASYIPFLLHVQGIMPPRMEMFYTNIDYFENNCEGTGKYKRRKEKI